MTLVDHCLDSLPARYAYPATAIDLLAERQTMGVGEAQEVAAGGVDHSIGEEGCHSQAGVKLLQAQVL